MNQTILIYIALGVGVIVLLWQVYLTIVLFRYQGQRKNLIAGVKGEGVEKYLEKQAKDIRKAQAGVGDLQDVGKRLSRVVSRSVTKVGVIRFNPFGDTGGNQSFAVAFLDSKNNGVVLSSLYGRDGTRIYCKEIRGGISEHPLSEEEQNCIMQAQQNSTNKEESNS
ncbi:MAG: DUF4446 family protein [bacterium]